MATKSARHDKNDLNERLVSVLEDLRDRLAEPEAGSPSSSMVDANNPPVYSGATSGWDLSDFISPAGKGAYVGTSSLASTILTSKPAVRAALEGEADVDNMRAKFKTVNIDGEQFYVAEGDTLLDEDQLLLYAQQRVKSEEAFRWMSVIDAVGLGVARLAAGGFRGLLGITHNGRTVRWAPGTTLTYRVARDSFTSAARYNMVVQHMASATTEWMDTCGVSFQHLSAADTSPGVGPGGALFVVREIDARGSFIASAFFPNDPVNRRRVLIDPSYYTTDFDKTGVLRHELGHVLGFRHEHIRSGAPAICLGESTDDTIDLTQYDPRSVMHYFCGGVGTRELRISDLDRNGAQIVYGPPLSSVEFIDS